MILSLHTRLRSQITSVIQNLYDLGPGSIPTVVVEQPPNRRFGDLAVTVAFELARSLQKPPRLIAQEISEAAGDLEEFGRLHPTGAGYLNVFLDRAAFIRVGLSETQSAPPQTQALKIIVEHTAINPNKAAHVGHLRNATLGDTLCRLLRFRGASVEVQNYIDDTGVQVADVVVGFRELEHQNIEDIRQLTEKPGFDHYCWDLYARVTAWYEEDDNRLSHRRTTLEDLEHGVDPSAAIAKIITGKIVRCHLNTMARLDVEYDLLSWEGDILRLAFWDRAFEVLKNSGAVFLQQGGRLSGCWVMPIGNAALESTDDDESDLDPETRLKVIVRSNGTVTYVGKDIAYQLWKFGLLGLDFNYRWFGQQPSGRPLWATSSNVTPDSAKQAPPPFGHAEAVYNVIDTRQSYLQDLLAQALEALDHPLAAERSVHFSYEMVALSKATAQALGHLDPTLDDGKPFVEVSGRKGLGVKADDLLNQVTDRAESEVASRHADLSLETRREIATQIATAAIRYFMIKFSRSKVIAFDIDEALSFEGETGPYLQYATVRARRILEKLKDRDGIELHDRLQELASSPADSLTASTGDDLWDLILESYRLDEIAEQSVRSLELSTLAKYTFGLAQRFNGFYHSSPVIGEPNAETRLWRAAGVKIFDTQMTRAIQLMGCQVPERM